MNIWLLISGDIFEPCKAEIRSWHWLGMKRKVEEEDPEDGQRTIRRKARENRKTQQGMWFYMKRLILKFNLYHLFVYYLSDFDDWLPWSDWVKTHAQEKGFMDVKVIQASFHRSNSVRARLMKMWIHLTKRRKFRCQSTYINEA